MRARLPPFRRGLGVLLAVMAGFALAGCATSPGSKPGASAKPIAPSELCTRIHTSSNLVELQIAIRKFVPARGKGPAIWLTGVSHIGDPDYYVTLQKHLDAQTLVLYEGVSDAARGHSAAKEKPAPSGGGQPGLQEAMAGSLGLVFQLDAIDYDHPNFRNSDLSVGQLRQLLEEMPAASGEASAGQGFESLMQLMQGGSLLDGILQMTMRFLGASPKLRGLSKLALAETLGQLNGDPGRLGGLPPAMKQLLDVLVARRNANVMADLKREAKIISPHGSISIFYGTGHMPDLERRLRQELHYRAAEELWLTAFSVDLAKAGITESERQFLHDFVKRELEQMKAVDISGKKQ